MSRVRVRVTLLGLLPLAAALLGLGGCGAGDGKGSAPSSPEGVWVFDEANSDAVFGSNVSCSGDSVVEAALSVQDGIATFSVETESCSLGPQEGPVAEGDDGVLANLTNAYGETSTLTCFGDGPDAYLCEHSWLDGELQMTRL